MKHNQLSIFHRLRVFAASNARRGQLQTALVFVAVLPFVARPARGDIATEAWVQRYNGPTETDDEAQKVVVDASGDVVVVGNSYGRGSGFDWLIIKYSSAGVPVWTNRYNGGVEYDVATAVAVDGSSNILVTGYSRSFSLDYDYLTIKYSSAGLPLWTNRFNGPVHSDDKATALAVDGSGNIYVTGDSFGDYLTLKYSPDGTLLWTRRYNGPANVENHAKSLAVDAGGNVVVTGYSYGLGSSADYATIAYSSGGESLWTNRYNGPANTSDNANAVAVDGGGNVFVTGFSGGIGSSSDIVTIAYSSAGIPAWTNRYNGPGSGNSSDEANAIAVDGRGNVIVTGLSNDGGSSKFITVAYSNAGAELWRQTYNGPASLDSANAVTVGADDNMYVTGTSARTNVFPYNYDYVTIMYSGVGSPIWTNRYNGPGNGDDRPNSVAVDRSGSVFVTGSSFRTNAARGNFDYATIKYSNSGVPVWTNRYEQPANDSDFAMAVVADGSGNIFVTGNSYGSVGVNDYATIKYSGTGAPIWTNRYNGPRNGDDTANAMAVDGSGNVFVTGGSVGNNYSFDFLTIKYSNDGVPLWTNRYGLGYSDSANAVATDASGNVFVTGPSFWTSTNSSFLTVAYSSTGEELWAMTYIGPAGRDRAGSVAVGGSGNIYVTGGSDQRQQFPYNTDYATVAYSSDGALLWVNRYNGPGNDEDSTGAIVVDGRGNVVVTGNSVGVNGSLDYLTIAYSSLGVPLWTNRYDGPANGIDMANAVAVDPDGNVFVTGTSVGSRGTADYATIAYTSAGTQLWVSRYSAPGNTYNEAKAIAVDVSGNVIVTGIANGDYLTIAYSKLGVPLWTNLYDGPFHGYDSPRGKQALAVGLDGSVYVTGDSAGDFATVKYAPFPSRPILEIQAVTPGTIRICWPTNAANYMLEFKDQIYTSVPWLPTGASVGIEGTSFCVTNRTDGGSTRYYRLRSSQGM